MDSGERFCEPALQMRGRQPFLRIAGIERPRCARLAHIRRAPTGTLTSDGFVVADQFAVRPGGRVQASGVDALDHDVDYLTRNGGSYELRDEGLDCQSIPLRAWLARLPHADVRRRAPAI
jgi:hypothetical protein